MISWRRLMGGEGAGETPRVGFLIAGVQKGGTFSLYRLLERHPQISLSKSKEVHFFDNEAVDWSSPRYGAISPQLSPVAAGPGSRRGDAHLYLLARGARAHPRL